MSTSRSSLRGALAVALVAVLGVTGALVASSSATAVPAPPSIDTPLDSTDGIFSTTVNPVDNGLEQTIRVFTRSDENVVVERCVVATIATPVNCNVIIPPGEYGFYQLYGVSTDVNGPSAPSASQSLRYGAPAVVGSLVLGTPLSSPAVPNRIGTLQPLITGTAPAIGTVEMRGYRSDLGVVTETILCSTSVPLSGAFECPATFPSYGVWEVRVIARDVEGGVDVEPEVESTLRLEIFPPLTTTTVSTSSAAIGASLVGVVGSNVGGQLVVDAFGAPVLGEGYCPQGTWMGDPLIPPTDGNAINCAYTDVPAGVHLLRSDQFINGTNAITRDDAIFVPAAPTLLIEPVPGGAKFSGTVDPLNNLLTASGTRVDALQVQILNAGEPGQVRCFAAVDPATDTWACALPLETGAQSFTVVAESDGFADDPGALGSVDGYVDGLSAPSALVNVVIPPGIAPFDGPTMTYGFGPASIRADAAGITDSSIGIELYSITEPDGQGGGYFYGQPLRSCGVVGEGANGGSIVTAPSVIDDCLFAGLTPGIWNVYSSQVYYFERSEYVDDYVRIPVAPTLTVARNDAGQAVASGQGDPGFRVLVRQLGGAGACDTTVATDGTWRCTVPGVASDSLLRAQQQSQGFVAQPNGETTFRSFDGYSAYTPTAVVPSPVTALPTAAVPPAPLSWVLEGYDGGPLFPGQQLSLSARGLPVGTEVIVEIRSTPQVLGSSLVDDLGVFALDVTVPRDLEPGNHTLVALATPPGGVVSTIEIPVVVVPAPVPDAEAGEQESPTAAGSAGEPTGLSGVDRADPAAPSAISDSIPTLDRIFRTPLAVVAAGGLALAILLLVAFPAELLNSTLASNSRRLGRWYAAIDDRLERATEWFASVTRTRALAAALLVVATAVIFGFVDPDYGFDSVSLRMTLSLAIGLFIITYVASWISGAIIKRVWGIPTRVSLQPAALLFAVIGVVAARLLDFSPGFLIGLVIGLDLLTKVGGLSI